MKLAAVAVFGAGYVLGTRAGRDRYEQIVAFSTRLADRLEDRAEAGRAGESSSSGSSSGGPSPQGNVSPQGNFQRGDLSAQDVSPSSPEVGPSAQGADAFSHDKFSGADPYPDGG